METTTTQQTELLNHISVRIAGYRIEISDSVEQVGHDDTQPRTANVSVYKRGCKLFTGKIVDTGWGGPINTTYNTELYPYSEIEKIVSVIDDEAKNYVWRYFPPKPVNGQTMFATELSFEDILDFGSLMCMRHFSGKIDTRFAGKIVGIRRFANMVENM